MYVSAGGAVVVVVTVPTTVSQALGRQGARMIASTKVTLVGESARTAVEEETETMAQGRLEDTHVRSPLAAASLAHAVLRTVLPRPPVSALRVLTTSAAHRIVTNRR